jgi:hypothetical protein
VKSRIVTMKIAEMQRQRKTNLLEAISVRHDENVRDRDPSAAFTVGSVG